LKAELVLSNSDAGLLGGVGIHSKIPAMNIASRPTETLDIFTNFRRKTKINQEPSAVPVLYRYSLNIVVAIILYHEWLGAVVG
jgi:hypothetical protein